MWPTDPLTSDITIIIHNVMTDIVFLSNIVAELMQLVL